MKKSTKLIASAAALTLAVGSLAGCGGDEKTSSGQALTYWAAMDGASAQTLTNYSEMLMYQEIEKATGVKVDFIHPVAGSTGKEAFTTLLASSDLPDMIEVWWTDYAGGPQAAIDDGVIIRLNDYLEEWAPNYYDWVAGEKNEANNGQYGLQTMTDNGDFYGFNLLTIGNSRYFSGLIIRSDLLEDWGMDVPETIADWEAVFAKAKAEGYEKPFTCPSGRLSPLTADNTFNTAYGVGRGYYIEDGKVVFAPLQPGYKEFVAQLADWVKKGYIDPNFVTNSPTDYEGNMTNGTSIACYGFIGGCMGKLLPAMAERDPEYNLVACPYPVLNEGDECIWKVGPQEAKSIAIGITTSCEDVESAMKWCDYIYGEEGNLIHTFGVEGDTYTVEEINGETHYVYTDKIQKPETIGLPSVNAALYKFFRPANGPGLDQHPDYLNGYYPYQSQKDALVIWNEVWEKTKPEPLPALSFTTEESSRMATLNQEHQAAFETAINEIIAGNKSIDEYDSVIANAKKNIYDEILKIHNDAYQRYLGKIKK